MLKLSLRGTLRQKTLRDEWVEYSKKGRWTRPHAHTEATSSAHVLMGCMQECPRCSFGMKQIQKSLGWQNRVFKKYGFPVPDSSLAVVSTGPLITLTFDWWSDVAERQKGGCLDQGVVFKIVISWLPWFSWFPRNTGIYSDLQGGCFQNVIWWFSGFPVWEKTTS